MSKSAIAAIVVVVILLAGGGIYLATSGNSGTKTTTTNMDMNKSPDTSGTTPSATNSVTIQSFAFSPANITIKKGTAVTWTNKDGVTHTVTEIDGQKGPDSGDLASGKSYSFTFTSTGTFKYHCAIHPSMTGTVTVTE